MYPIEPLIPMVLWEFIEVPIAASLRILAMPKSPTRALISARTNSSPKFQTLDGIGPSRLLILASSSVRLVRFPMEDGICPDKLLESRYNRFNLVSAPMLSGMTPESKPDGIAPDMPFPNIRSCWRLVDILANEFGSFPMNLLQAMDRSSNLLQFVKEVRNSHSFSSFVTNSLPSMCRSLRCPLLPMLAGMEPWR
ncbi:hypothetical protein PVAP13_1NG101388 [Panicum virgatum]|uniref:Uncharacterized protein n=1 Tax=Panicum virgatum TaxID=38727 RepID=A0A8T0WSH6_PANVG|nr:hypothetical protein PVAP13_1NG101388 [Panicum virgatum]